MFVHLSAFFCVLTALGISSALKEPNAVIASVARLSQLESLERDFIESADHFINAAENDNRVISTFPPFFRRFIRSVTDEYSNFDHQSARNIRFSHHPTNQYRLIHRAGIEWPAWRTKLGRDYGHSQHIRKLLQSFKDIEAEYPQLKKLHNNDLNYVCRALNLIHLVYWEDLRLDYGLSNVGLRVRELEPHELLHLFYVNYNYKDDDWSQVLAPFWLHRAMLKVRSVNLFKRNDTLVDFIISQRDNETRKAFGFPLDSVNHDHYLKMKSVAGDINEAIAAFEELLSTDDETNPSIGLCKKKMDHVKLNNMTCWYANIFRPSGSYFRLKIELMSEYPLLLTIHEFIPSGQVNSMILDTQSKLTTENIKGQCGRSNIIRRLSQRAEHESLWMNARNGFIRYIFQNDLQENPFSTSKITIENYGIGGFTNQNSFRDDENYSKLVSNDFWSMLVFLNDVPLGGNEVFPGLGVASIPHAGKAIIIKADQQTAQTPFGACPVAIGNKWVLRVTR